MKKIFLFMAFFAFMGISSFANNIERDVQKEIVIAEKQDVETTNYFIIKQVYSETENSCTVSVSYKNKSGKVINLSLTTTCICSVSEACDISYGLLSLVIPK